MTSPSQDKAAVKACFLAELDAAGITLPADLADAAASDFLVLHRQMRLIRDACSVDAPLPLGFVPLLGEA